MGGRTRELDAQVWPMKILTHYSPHDCGNGMCPGILVTDRDSVLVQGRILSEAAKAQLKVPGHEDVVEIPLSVFEDLVGQYRRR